MIATTTVTTTVKELAVHNRHNCYVFSSEQITDVQNSGVKETLEPGIHVVRIRKGKFDYIDGDTQVGEPIVMLWIYGGKFKNLKTNVAVPAGWSTLNGYDDTLTLAVLEPVTLCALFFDIYNLDNENTLTVSAIKVGELTDLD